MSRRKPVEIKPTVRIIDNKKVLMTPDEYQFYEHICTGYNRPNFQGSELFQDHFEVNDDGIIIFVKPPHKKYSSLEVFTFLVSLMVNQQLRIAQGQVQTLIDEGRKKYQEELAEVNKLKEELKSALNEVEQLKKSSVKSTSKRRKKTDDGTNK